MEIFNNPLNGMNIGQIILMVGAFVCLLLMLLVAIGYTLQSGIRFCSTWADKQRAKAVPVNKLMPNAHALELQEFKKGLLSYAILLGFAFVLVVLCYIFI